MLVGQIKNFTLIGLAAVILDLAVYLFLKELLKIDISIAKGLGFISGAILSFFFNKTITFKSEINNFYGLFKHSLVYGSSLVANIYVNSAIYLQFIEKYSNISIALAFICATSVSILMNFIGMKYYVFRK